MLYRRRDFMSEAGVFLDDFAVDPEATADAALGLIVRSDDWGAESWESAAKLAEQGRFLPGLADKCRSIAAEMRRQEGGQCS